MHFKSRGIRNEKFIFCEIAFHTRLSELMEIAFGNFFSSHLSLLNLFIFTTPLTSDTLLLLLAAAFVALNCEIHEKYFQWESEAGNKIQDIRYIEQNAEKVHAEMGVRLKHNFHLQH